MRRQQRGNQFFGGGQNRTFTAEDAKSAGDAEGKQKGIMDSRVCFYPFPVCTELGNHESFNRKKLKSMAIIQPANTLIDPTKRENQISGIILDAAIAVHSALGPGLLESAYEASLCYELSTRGLKFQAQVPLAVQYRGVKLDVAYRIDLIVEDLVIVELKAVEKLLPVHEAQLLSYLKLSNKKLGLLIDFHVLRLKDGYKRIVNGL